MAANADEETAPTYNESCTVAVVHLTRGRGNNEEDITETVIGTLSRAGYKAGAHTLLGFGASATGVTLPVGAIVSMGLQLRSLVCDWIASRRLKEVRCHLPSCVVQLVVSSEGKNEFQTNNLAAGLLAVLCTILDDLQEAGFQRRYRFMIFATAPAYSEVAINIDDEDMKLKHLARMVRECGSGTAPEGGGEPTAHLSLYVAKRHWWTPRKVHAVKQPNVG